MDDPQPFIPDQPGVYLCSEFWDGEWKPFKEVDVFWEDVVVDEEGNTQPDLVFQSPWSEYTPSVYYSKWKRIEEKESRKVRPSIKDVFESAFYLRGLMKKRQIPIHWGFEHQKDYIKSDEYRKYKMAINTVYNFSPTLYKFLFKIGWLR